MRISNSDLADEFEARRRVVIEHATPEVDYGTYAAKRVVGDVVNVEADVLIDGHDELGCVLLYRREDEADWHEFAMTQGDNDRWHAEFEVAALTTYLYKIEAWPDRLRTWQRDLKRRLDAGQDVEAEMAVGAALLREVIEDATPEDAERLEQRATALAKDWPADVRAELALDESLLALASCHARRSATVYDRGQRIVVDRERARFGAWYELFPRSTSPIAGKPGTLRTAMAWLSYIQEMGFDVVYLPPIHPIGQTNRKGKNNDPKSTPSDPGSPWAIGGSSGGHKAIDPALGTLEDFRDLVEAARGRDMEIALDIAFQCSPDHPYVNEHPDWFRHRPDGSIRYAENPPKRYEDIYPLDFENEDWFGLWQELESVVRFWIDQGVRIFRVDNPHTKPFAFWHWLIERIRVDHPDVIFLAEAFTRPRRMYYLAKIGFSQSYTYFTWRNNRWDLMQYFTELTQTDVKEYFRPNLWPNTPDILNEYLQQGGRPAFVIRLILAATLSASYGIYGPAFELGVAEPREPGSEEYAHSEKYEVHHWDVTAEHSLRELIARVNRIRRENEALQRDETLKFIETNNESLIAYIKTNPGGDNLIITVVNLDPFNTQAGLVRVPLWEHDISYDAPYEVYDLLDDAYYHWSGEWNYVRLDPQVSPAHILHLRRTDRAPDR